MQDALTIHITETDKDFAVTLAVSQSKYSALPMDSYAVLYLFAQVSNAFITINAVHLELEMKTRMTILPLNMHLKHFTYPKH